MSGWGTATVFTSRGARAFHGILACRARWAGRDLNDWDVNDKGRLWVPGCRALNTCAVEKMTIPEAMGAGKLPCLVCMPGLGASWFRTPCEDGFGHEPVDHCGDAICRRCRTHHVDEDGEHYSLPAFWPCTSALVLGLVPRPGVCPDCGAPVDPPPPGSSKCPPCDDNERLDALGTAL